MSKIRGKYREITPDELIKYTGIDKRFIKVLSTIYSENEARIPYDILAAYTDIASYTVFEKEYCKEHGNVLMGKVEKIFNENVIKPEYFSESLKVDMEAWNIVPYNMDEEALYLIAPDIEMDFLKQGSTDPNKNKFHNYIATLKIALQAGKRKVNIVRATNKLYCDVLYKCLGKELFAREDVEIRDSQLLNIIFIQAITQEASDIYLDPLIGVGINVSFSIYGDTIHFRTIRMKDVKIIALMQAVFNASAKSYDDASFRNDPMKDFKIENLGDQNGEYYGRAQAILQDNVLHAVIRVAESNKSAVPFDKLRLSTEIKNKLETGIKLKSGLILMAGKTGSGKTTTIYSCIDYMVKNISTDRIEEYSNPVEAKIQGVSQFYIDEEKGLTMERYVEAATRRNAQRIFIGELNTNKITRDAIDLALQGKYIISTLHSSSIPMIFDRVLGMTMGYPDSYRQFIELTHTLVHQTMVKQACPHCMKHVRIEDLKEREREILQSFGYSKDTVPRLSHDTECEYCEGRGFFIKKPIILASILTLTEDIKDKIREMDKGMRVYVDNLMFKSGSHELFDGIRHMEKDLVTFDQVYSALDLDMLREDFVIACRAM